MHISCMSAEALWGRTQVGFTGRHIIDVFENQQQQISSPQQESCRNSMMKFDMTESITGQARESNGDAPHVRKPRCTFVKNAMLDSIQIVTSSFTSRSNLIDILVL